MGAGIHEPGCKAAELALKPAERLHDDRPMPCDPNLEIVAQKQAQLPVWRLAAKLRDLADAHEEMADSFEDAATEGGNHYADLADEQMDMAKVLRQLAEQLEGDSDE